MSDTDDGIDHLAHLAADSARFLEVIRTADPDAPVPACPDWTADDLLYHLAEVQNFWATIVRERLQTGEQAEAVSTERPDDRDALVALFRRASGDLLAALSATPPETPVWSWADDHTAGFSYRRQAHEALIHRVDAELTAGAERDPIDADLAGDGIDEVLNVMFGEPQDWLEFRPNPGQLVEVTAVDTGRSWLRVIGHAVGTSPSGREIDWLCLERPERTTLSAAFTSTSTPTSTFTATVTGSAADLDCWLWNRAPVGRVELTGDQATLASLRSIVDDGVQ